MGTTSLLWFGSQTQKQLCYLVTVGRAKMGDASHTSSCYFDWRWELVSLWSGLSVPFTQMRYFKSQLCTVSGIKRNAMPLAQKHQIYAINI